MESSKTTATEREARLIAKFRDNPELFDLFLEVTRVYEEDPGKFENLHAIETYLLEKVRAIGNNALGQWAASLGKEVTALEREKEGVRRHSKKNSTSLPY